MMRKPDLLCAVAVLTAITTTSAIADTYKFNLYNDSSQYVINGFRTYENGEWSGNWMDFTLKPGESAEMDWGTDEGNCVVPFEVDLVGYESERYEVDWCKLHNLHMEDDGFTWD